MLSSALPTFLTFAGGEIAPEAVCSFTVTLLVPAGVVDDAYTNITSPLSATIGSPVTVPAVTLPAAIDDLIVDT